MKKFLLLILIAASSFTHAQSVSFEDFLILSKDFLNENALNEIKSILPKEFYISAEDIGDFSGDGKNDFAIAVDPKGNRGNDIYVYLFCDSLGHYERIFADTLKYFELPIEIGFSISKNVCYITHKLKDRSWKITGYTFNRNEFSFYDLYETDVVHYSRRSEVGEENYINYENMNGFNGYFDLSDVNQLRKSKYFIFPVYDLKRNIFKGYKHKFHLDNYWFWDSTKAPMDIGVFQLSTSGDYLNMDFKLYDSVFQKIDFTKENSLQFYFDKSGEKIIKNSARLIKRTPVFRENVDDKIGSITVNINEDSSKEIMNVSLPQGYSKENLKSIKFVHGLRGKYRLQIPLKILDIPEGNNELPAFIQFTFTTKDKNQITLRSGDGDITDPVSYGKLVFIHEEKYYTVLQNVKFAQLIAKFEKNGLKQKKINYLP